MAKGEEIAVDIEQQRPRVERPALSRKLTTFSWNHGKKFNMTKFAVLVNSSETMTHKPRLDAVKMLFDRDEVDLEKWPGIMVFCWQMESRFSLLYDERFTHIIQQIVYKDRLNSSPSSVDGWEWTLAVFRAFQAPPQEVAQNKEQILQAIFAVLCWSSALLTPVIESEASGSPAPSLSAENSGRTYTTKDLRRPLSKLYYSFRQNSFDGDQGYQFGPGHEGMVSAHNTTTQPGGDEVLYQSSLDYFSLDAIGRVKITPEKSPKSRKLLLQRLKLEEAARGSSGLFDPFLYVICTSALTSFWGRKNISVLPGEIFPHSVRDVSEQLQEEASYLARDDFPVFGPRLLTLQRYNLRQQPSKIRDLWRDKRNPLQWYTFWAVFWVGGASILLSILQLLVGVAQLYAAVQMPTVEAG
ncbi:hypothetical protein QBC40DRAFT_351070 [Triangularia verruculosa]|uniref:Uncharacterized protein n=1 Tax=Triangularia verruculosa TaxID=2587418 RepID=A0AAN6XEW1_9PEZI|nr:hypothetical protein QBC40DRAFT_351070 [Triangularia verruculosa]